MEKTQKMRGKGVPRTVPCEVSSLFDLVLEEEHLNVASPDLLALILFEFDSEL